MVSVSSDGTIRYVGPGSTLIRAISNEDNSCYTSCLVTALIPVSGISLNITEDFVDVGQTLQLTATVVPSDAYDRTVEWYSNNPAAATVSRTGLVTCVGGGVANITATAVYGGLQATCRVTSLVPVTSIDLGRSSLLLHANTSYRFTPVISPSNATVKDIRWTSSNPGAVTVSADGKLTYIAPGEATVTATSVRYGNNSRIGYYLKYNGRFRGCRPNAAVNCRYYTGQCF